LVRGACYYTILVHCCRWWVCWNKTSSSISGLLWWLFRGSWVSCLWSLACKSSLLLVVPLRQWRFLAAVPLRQRRFLAAASWL
jgi:hypothetical protein